LNGITSVLNSMKIYQAVQKLLVGDTQTDRQTGDLINLLSFLESRLKMHKQLSVMKLMIDTCKLYEFFRNVFHMVVS
jgi:hypothetical protein